MPSLSNATVDQLLAQAISLHQSGMLERAEPLYRQILDIENRHSEAITLLATLYAQQGRLEEAIRLFDKSLSINRLQPFALNNRGNCARALKRLQEALANYDNAIAMRPNFADAYNNRGITLQDLKRYKDAVESYKNAISLQPENADAHYNCANALRELGRLDDALIHYDQAIALQRGFAAAHLNKGSTLQALQRYAEALASYDKAIALVPGQAEAYANLASVLRHLKQYENALASCEKAILLNQNYAQAHVIRSNIFLDLERFVEAVASCNKAISIAPHEAAAYNSRGSALRRLKRYELALSDFDRAISLAPNYAEALNNKGNALSDCKRYVEALACFERAIAINPAFADAFCNQGVALQNLRRYDEALASYNWALTLQHDFADAYANRGNLLGEILRYEEAAHDFEKLLRLSPDREYARGQLLHFHMHCCQWRDFHEEVGAVVAGIKAGSLICTPFPLLAVSNSPADLQACARIYAGHVYPKAPNRDWRGRSSRAKIRLGYVSGEFRDQATAYLAAGLFETHDRNAFEVYAFDNGFDDKGPMRKRLESAFDAFVDISGQSDEDAAALIVSREIDILIDLNGFFGLQRGGVFALRAAPIQVNYLGAPATLGADFMDYIIADRVVIPESEQHYYDEKVVYLPNSYQVNDDKRHIADRAPTRAAVGLPENAFVFCSFNNSYKYTPAVFDIWMRLLRNVEGSVLWLLESNGAMARNLRHEAEMRGLPGDRLVFAPYAKVEDHLARHRLGDLFLDSLPCNAHTTASDALWAGLPLVTCAGAAFSGRVAASLLTAIGLRELITHNLDDYESLALRLARDPGLLEAIQTKLVENRNHMPLFDTGRYRRHVEAAYTRMWERHMRGEAPAGFTIDPL